jgi:hypothetical protein
MRYGTPEAIDLGDFLDFDVRRTGGLDAAAGFRAVRYSIQADLAGRRFEQFPVDVALDEHRQELVQWLRVPDLLAFAEIEAPELPVVPLERQVAEKLHAYTATYGGARIDLRQKSNAATTRCRAHTTAIVGEAICRACPGGRDPA